MPSSRKAILTAALFATLPLALSGLAVAATDTTTFTVTANIIADCNLSATNMGFSTYDPANGTAADQTSTISIYCSNGQAYTVSLNVGTGGGTFTTRTMASGGNTLNYNLYTTTGRTTVWGDGTGSTATVGGTGTGLLVAHPHTVYGRIPAGQDSNIGSYTTTITVTVTY